MNIPRYRRKMAKDGLLTTIKGKISKKERLRANVEKEKWETNEQFWNKGSFLSIPVKAIVCLGTPQEETLFCEQSYMHRAILGLPIHEGLKVRVLQSFPHPQMSLPQPPLTYRILNWVGCWWTPFTNGHQSAYDHRTTNVSINVLTYTHSWCVTKRLLGQQILWNLLRIIAQFYRAYTAIVSMQTESSALFSRHVIF